MTDSINVVPDQRSIDDQLIDIVRDAERAGRYDGANWIKRVAMVKLEQIERGVAGVSASPRCTCNHRCAPDGELCVHAATCQLMHGATDSPSPDAPRTDAVKEAIGMRERFLAARASDIASSNLFVESGAYDLARGVLTPEHFSMLGMLVFINHYATVLPEDEEQMSKRAHELAEKYGWEDRIAARREPDHAD